MRANAIDRGGARVRSAGSDVGKHLAALVVDDQRRTIAHVSISQTGKMKAQAIEGQSLQITIQGGLQALTGHAQQRPGQMWRQSHRCSRLTRSAQQPFRGLLNGHAGSLRIAKPCTHAGAPRHPVGARRRRREQRCQHFALIGGQSGGRLAGKRKRRRANALPLAAVGQQVQISLEDLRLAPACLQRPGHPHLIQLVAPGASSIDRRRVVALAMQQPGQLHTDGAGATPALVQHAVAQRGQHAANVDTAVLEEASILAGHHGIQQCRRHVRQRHPGESSHPEIDPFAVQQAAMAIQQKRLGWPVAIADLIECRHRLRPAQPQRKQSQRHDRQQAQSNQRAATPLDHCAAADTGLASTVNSGFGSSPNISGAYSASTRVAGSRNSPGLFRRTLYSTLHFPFGTNR